MVALSLLVAITSAFVAISVVPRLHDRRADGRRTALWTLAFGLSLGTGIWTMHFVAMLAFRLPVAVRYDITITAASLFIAIGFCSLGALPMRHGGDLRDGRLLLVGSVLGAGVAAMHYTGMAAMRLPAEMHYDTALVLLSLLIAVSVATVALWIANRLRGVGVLDELPWKTAAAVVMGLAVAAMHYTGMAAVHFLALDGQPASGGLDRTLMIVALTVIAMLVQGGILISAALDQALMAQRRLRHSEAERMRIHTIVETSPDFIAIVDPTGKIRYLNPAGHHLVGLPAEVDPPLLRECLHPDEADRLQQEILPQLQREARYQTRLRLAHRDGSEIHTLAAFTTLPGGGSDAGSFSIMARDIRREIARQEKMEHTQRLESLGVLAGGIAHDFNNILTAILGNAAIAERKARATNEDLARYLSNIVRSSERAADLCKQMLAYSGKGKFVVQPLDLSQLVTDITKLLEVSIGKSVVLKYRLAEGLPPVEADAAQIQQLIMNLVINASEAIGEKSGVITVTTGLMHADRDYLRETCLDEDVPEGRYAFLEVADTGCGMDEATRKRIFEPFYTTKFTGRGLGMSAVLGIVRGHHGTMKLYTEPGAGTTFKVLLPVSTRVEQPSADPAANGDDTAPPWRGEGTVLIIDDEETVRTSAAMMVEALGFDTLTAADGKEGVACYRAHRKEIVVVLLDMTMPRLDGRGCFRELRRIDKDVRVILTSGYNEEEVTSHFAGKGLAGFIQKPYRPELLAERLRAALARRPD
ncbi:MAG: response regulator [Zetaproteobacteria bacterium]|nr:MAG: response regulator [Zetaproteobacteria bacterium]